MFFDELCANVVIMDHLDILSTKDDLDSIPFCECMFSNTEHITKTNLISADHSYVYLFYCEEENIWHSVKKTGYVK